MSERGDMPPWLEEFALHVRNQTLDIVAKCLLEGAAKWEAEGLMLRSLAGILEKAKNIPASEWWMRKERTP